MKKGRSIKNIIRKCAGAFLSLAVLISIAAAAVSCTAVPEENGGEEETRVPGAVLYVSPDGSRDGEGTKDSPLSSLEDARDRVRKIKDEQGIPDGGIDVVFLEGVYKFRDSVVLGAEDSGRDGSPVVYRADEGAKVVFDGGVDLDPANFRPASEEFKKRIADQTAREALLEIDLKAEGCYDLEDGEYGRYSGTETNRQELYVDSERAKLAQWPNGSAYQTGGFRTDEDNDAYYYIPEEKYELWKNDKNFWYYGCPEIDWFMIVAYQGQYMRLDEKYKALALIDCNFVPNKDSNLWVQNIPEEIDEPGEYYWDTDTGMLYYYPKKDVKESTFSFSQLPREFVRLESVENIVFDGIIFENGRGSAVYSPTGDQNHTDNRAISVRNCTFRCIGANALWFFATESEITGNSLYELGCGGIWLRGGDNYNEHTVHSRNVISDNVIHDVSQRYKIDEQPIRTIGTGFTISRNLIYNAPHSAIIIFGAETVVEYNCIHDVCRETSDAGAIYTGRSWAYANSAIRYNYIYSIPENDHGGRPCGIYLDDMVASLEVRGNIVKDVSGVGIGLCSGKYNLLENNLLIDCGGVPISNDQRGFSFNADHVVYKKGSMWTGLQETHPYDLISRYYFPKNLLMIEDSLMSSIYRPDDPGICSYTTVRGNVALGCISDVPWEDSDFGDKYTDTITTDGGFTSVPMSRLYGTVEGNVYYPGGTDIGLVFSDDGSVSLSEDSRVYRDIPGFDRIPFDRIAK